MGAIAFDVENMVEVNTVAFRVLSDNLGDVGTRAFINQFKNSGVRAVAPKPRVSASQIADILERSRVKVEARRGKGEGDYTKEKYEEPSESFEESVAGMMRMQSLMNDVGREHPELPIGQRAGKAMIRSAEHRVGASV